jgi:hypothetical protein
MKVIVVRCVVDGEQEIVEIWIILGLWVESLGVASSEANLIGVKATSASLH